MGRTVHNHGSHRRRRLQTEESEDSRGRGKSMERSEPTPVLPIVPTSHAHLAAHVNLRCNKMMLPKSYHNKALGGLEHKSSPRETLSSQSRSLTKALGGSRAKAPPQRSYSSNRDLVPKH